ncbi:MAG: hypothetical protein U0R69_16895, partial [Gaiellales bacterium]
MARHRDLSSEGPIRAGLAGCGRIAARFHLPVLAAMDGVELVAFAEPDPERRRAAVSIAPGAAAPCLGWTSRARNAAHGNGLDGRTAART